MPNKNIKLEESTQMIGTFFQILDHHAMIIKNESHYYFHKKEMKKASDLNKKAKRMAGWLTDWLLKEVGGKEKPRAVPKWGILFYLENFWEAAKNGKNSAIENKWFWESHHFQRKKCSWTKKLILSQSE